MKYGPWRTIHKCTKCDEYVSEWHRMYGMCCPHCGNNDGSTIVPTNIILRRKVYDFPWWQFWKKPKIEYKYEQRKTNTSQ